MESHQHDESIVREVVSMNLQVMRYGVKDLICAMLLGLVLGATAVSAVWQDTSANAADRVLTGHDDAVGIASCIAEHAYTHPKRERFAELVAGIRWCNVIDAAVAHRCITPCNVILPKDTLEDEFGINYGWKDHRPRVEVYVTR